MWRCCLRDESTEKKEGMHRFKKIKKQTCNAHEDEKNTSKKGKKDEREKGSVKKEGAPNWMD